MLKSFDKKSLHTFLEEYYKCYNKTDFIHDDPISIPHDYTDPLDIEITGLWTAILSWGQRKTIINKAKELFGRMDGQPYDFITNHSPKERRQFSSFKHRTFQPEDCITFLEFFQEFYKTHRSLEEVFNHSNGLQAGMSHFRNLFENFSGPKHRSLKHISSPSKKSACKRINMFLRWMVRKDNEGVDFGIWKSIDASQLFIPLDVHVGRIARQLNILTRKQNDWLAVEELTNVLKSLDPKDPVKYDYALFGLGILENKK